MSNTQREDQEREFEELVYRAVRSAGWLIPTTPEEVAASEELVPRTDMSLPDELHNPLAALDLRQRKPLPTHKAMPNDFPEEMARAARQAKDAISEEVEEQMRKDRDTAERESNEGGHA